MLAGAGLLQVVLLAVVGGHRGDGLAQRLLLLGFDELLMVSSGVVHSGKYGADVDLLADLDVEFGEHAVAGEVTVCSIFIASSHTSGCPAVTVSPTAAPTRSTEPGMGASSDPCATAASGSGKRGSATNCTGPSGESTNTSTP